MGGTWELLLCCSFLKALILLAFSHSHKIFCLVIFTYEDESHIELNWLFCVYAPFS